MKNIIYIDKNSRIVVEKTNYTLQFRRKSEKRISWRVNSYHANLTSLSLVYLNSAPQRCENAINSILELVQVINNAESRICQIIINNKKNENCRKNRHPR